jgi:DNA-binding beta-propeller fold protein YncE
VPEAGSRRGRAFICYDRVDAERIRGLRGKLRAAGVRVYRDPALPWPGKSRYARIQHAIERDALVFIACFSQAGLSRKAGGRNLALLLAIDELRRQPPQQSADDPWFFPVRLEECDIPRYNLGVGRTLGSVHRIDLFGDRRDEAAAQLVAAVSLKLGIPPRDGSAAHGRPGGLAGWRKPGWRWALIAAVVLVAGALPLGLTRLGSTGSTGSTAIAGSTAGAGSTASPTAQPSMAFTPQPPVALPTGINRLMEGSRPPGFVIPSSPSAPSVHKYAGSAYHFDYPTAIAADGTHVWVDSPGSNSVTELNASDGSVADILSASRFHFDDPDAITEAGGHVWVANALNNTVTELNASDGTLVKVLTGPSYDFSYPRAIAADGTHVWVANTGAPHGSVTEIDEASGKQVQVLTAASYSFDGPEAIAADGTHVWVLNASGGRGSLTELNAASGTLVQVISDRSYSFDIPEAIADDGAHVWVANGMGNSLTELNAATGRLLRVVFEGSYYFSLPTAITVDGPVIWVASGYGDFLTEVRVTDGTVLRILPTSSYAFNEPSAIAVSGTNLWVTDGNGNYVTELPAS